MYGKLDEENNLEELLKATRAVLNASKGVDVDEIGKQIARRQILIDVIKSSGGLSVSLIETRQALINKIMLLDGEVCRSIRERMQSVGVKAQQYKKKVSGLRQYNSAIYNLASGQLIDRRK